MLLGIPLSRNVTKVTVTEAPFSLTMLSSTALTVPLTVPVLIAPPIKYLPPHPHQAARRAKPSVSDRRRFTTPPPFGGRILTEILHPSTCHPDRSRTLSEVEGDGGAEGP